MRASDPRIEPRQLAEAWKAHKLKQVRAGFAALSATEQVPWIDEPAPRLQASPVVTPGLRRRLVVHDRAASLISRVVLDVCANGHYASACPYSSDRDPVMCSMAEGRRH